MKKSYIVPLVLLLVISVGAIGSLLMNDRYTGNNPPTSNGNATPPPPGGTITPPPTANPDNRPTIVKLQRLTQEESSSTIITGVNQAQSLYGLSLQRTQGKDATFNSIRFRLKSNSLIPDGMIKNSKFELQKFNGNSWQRVSNTPQFPDTDFIILFSGISQTVTNATTKYRLLTTWMDCKAANREFDFEVKSGDIVFSQQATLTSSATAVTKKGFTCGQTPQVIDGGPITIGRPSTTPPPPPALSIDRRPSPPPNTVTPPPAPRITQVKMKVGDVFFSPNHIDAKLNQPVELTITNEGSHTFTIDIFGINETIKTATKVITFTPTKAGTFTFYCAVPGHSVAGMTGTITVK